MKRGLYLPLMLTSLLVLFLAGLQLSSALLSGIRLDLTEHGLYRLSSATIEVISRLNEPVEWRFYHSRSEASEAPAIRAYAARVREYLEAYEERSSGMIRLIEIDPLPFSADEDDALAAGLESLQTSSGERIFFGLVARNSVDDEAIIPLFTREAETRLEYDLTRLIADIERPARPKLAILTSLPISPDRGAPNRFISEINTAYDLVWVSPDFDTTPEADAWLILHPGLLTQGQLYLIDQFALERGRILAFLDPMAHAALRPGPDGLPPLEARRASSLGALPARWGVSWDPQIVAMDQSLGLPVEIIDTDGRARLRAYPLWFSAGVPQMSTTDLALASLGRRINFGSPGALRAVEGSELRFEPLITTSEFGALTDADIAAGSPGPDALARDYQAEPQPIILAARLSGLADTAFPDGPPAGDIVFDPSNHRDRSAGVVDFVLVGDIDWLDDSYFLTQDPTLGENIVADNLALALNLVDMAVGEPALVSLRSRAVSERPMTRVDDLRATAESRYLEIQDRLEAEIRDAEARLQGLRDTGQSSALFSADNLVARDEAIVLRRQIASSRARLREIERDFRRDIDRLDASLQFWTIGVPPLLVLFAGLVGVFRRRRSVS
jgi:ABC-2 type transport system permease protein